MSVELAGANRLDSGGSWRGPVAPEDRLLSFTMQREEGEWRIADLPDARVVPETWFGQAYRRVSLYYLDPTAQIMVPEPVFLPRGDQLATALVDRLIQGPSRRLRGDVEQSFVPPDVDVELSVTVSDAGVADIRLTGGVPMPSERDAALMVSQLTWTLAAGLVADRGADLHQRRAGDPLRGDTGLRDGPGALLRPHRLPVDLGAVRAARGAAGPRCRRGTSPRPAVRWGSGATGSARSGSTCAARRSPG